MNPVEFKEIRKKLGYSQASLTKVLGYGDGKHMIYNMESGKSLIPPWIATELRALLYKKDKKK